MAQVAWTLQALDDLDAICLFIARDSPRVAKVFADRVITATERLAAFPESGRAVPEFGRRDLREVIVQNYRVIYRRSGDEVEILTVHHGARMVPELG